MPKKWPQYLSGLGIDYHTLVKKECSITLATLEFNSAYEIVAHSDGDLILHAISDAILGALGLRDIGFYFSDQDQENKKINSFKILQFALNQLQKYHYEINNIDLNLISNHIMIADKYDIIKEQLRLLLDCDFVNLKATRHEIHDFFRIDCYCQILLKRK